MIFKAELVLEENSPKRKCWVTSDYYLDDFVLSDLKAGDVDQKMFFIPTSGNERLFYYFSTLVHQEKLSQGYYEFWRELQDQQDKGGLYDRPPYGVSTNFVSDSENYTVNGYFGVSSEYTTRWVFDPYALSYGIENNLYEICLIASQAPDQCTDCRLYNMGHALNYPPDWWSR